MYLFIWILYFTQHPNCFATGVEDCDQRRRTDAATRDPGADWSNWSNWESDNNSLLTILSSDFHSHSEVYETEQQLLSLKQTPSFITAAPCTHPADSRAWRSHLNDFVIVFVIIVHQISPKWARAPRCLHAAVKNQMTHRRPLSGAASCAHDSSSPEGGWRRPRMMWANGRAGKLARLGRVSVQLIVNPSNSQNHVQMRDRPIKWSKRSIIQN